MLQVIRNPVDLGFDGQAIEDAWNTLVYGADRHEYGGAVALVARGGEIALYRATGWAVREPEDQRSPMGIDTIFDLASLTKVTATTPSILKLVAEGRIGLDQPVGEILPEFGVEGMKAGVTVKRLLTHSAGFRDWLPVSSKVAGEQAYIEAYAVTQPEWEPDTRVVYSDPGFITLGAVIQRVTGERLDAYAKRQIFHPLGMVDTMYTPPRSLRRRIAATESRRFPPGSTSARARFPRQRGIVGGLRHAAVSAAARFPLLKGRLAAFDTGNAFEAEPRPGSRPAGGRLRDGLIRGDVHDGNAWYGFGGIAGHAGLFGAAIDLFRYGQMWLNGGELEGARILPEGLVAQAIVNHTRYDDLTDVRGYGWRLLPP
ncbi:MAG: beta-lactamase family protein, partial [Chloroflexia bacterium]|nr:beta-lactamase family protein [Chloroflexia bacterium]